MSIPNGRSRQQWRRVSRSSPCPICGKPDWCCVTPDGRLCRCQRVELGAFRTGTDRTGVTYYLHRLSDGPRPAVELPPPAIGAAARRADLDTVNAVYDALLGGLVLSAAHREKLRRRGLVDSEIDRRLYRTLPRQGRAAKARQLAERFGAKVLLSVPGFIMKDKDGRKYPTIAGSAGMLIPCRDAAGRIAAMKTRADDRGDGPRYSYLSSAKCGGPGPGSPVHVPLGVTGSCPIIRLTEGELKADVAFALSGLPTLSLSGVAAWKPVLPLLRELQTEIVRVAFDADAAEKPAVARALAACIEGLTVEGFAVEVERWHPAHKGIDDALAACTGIEVLRGDAAGAYVAETLALATAGEPPPPPDPLDRLGDVLAEGGVEGLYGDAELLDSLARLAETDLPAFAARRVQLKGAGASVRDFDKVLAVRRAAVRAELPPRVVQAGYRVSGGQLVREQMTLNGPVDVPLSNFTAKIVAETTHDDGAERSVSLTVEGQLCDGRPLPRVEVPAADFAGLDWILPAWGSRAVVYAGRGTADHLRAAMQLLSGDVAQRMVYAHLGWRRIGEQWVYLHAGGAIGADGSVDGIEVSPPDALARYQLPAPPSGEQLRRAVHASLALLDLAPERIAFPLLSAVYRTVLGGTDFTTHLTGQTGVFKSELFALAQQHFGAELDARHLPGSWASTGNSLEAIAFAAKDALLVVDDFAPSGSTVDVARLHREAERLLRAQGNAAGRQRMRADGGLRPAKPPRGLILSTGEDIPRGQSVRARLFAIEVESGDIDAAKLTAAQRDAAEGLYAGALAGFIHWLAPQYDAVRGRLSAERAELRDHAASDGQHARTPGIVADLALGLRYLLDFAAAAGVLSAAERAALWEQGWRALCESGAAQAEHGRAADPVEQFLRLLAGAIGATAYVAGPDGRAPRELPEAWGWREEIRGAGENVSVEWVGCRGGTRIGWVEGESIYLEPEAAFAAAQGLAYRQGASLPITARTLWRRLRERGLLASWDKCRQRNTVRRTLEGVRDREVLHLRADALHPCNEPSEPSAEAQTPRISAEMRTVFADGLPRQPSDRPQNRPQKPSAKTGESPLCGRFGRSDSGRDVSHNGNETRSWTAPDADPAALQTPFDEDEGPI